MVKTVTNNNHIKSLYCDFRRSCNKNRNRRCGSIVVAMTTFLTKFKMTSCKKLHSSAYSKDLRWRIVWQRYGLQLDILKIAENLSVDKSTVSRVLHTFCSIGLVSKKAYPGSSSTQKNNTSNTIVYPELSPGPAWNFTS